jgi:peroxiredoxin
LPFKKKPKPLEAGAAAPGFALPRLDGGEASLQQITSAGPALLVFFKISCPVCQLALPFYERLSKSGALAVYGVSQNDASDTRGFAQRYGLMFPMLLDLENTGYPVSNAYGLTNVPTAFLVEPGGLIAQTIHGWNKSEVTALGSAKGVSVFRPGDQVPEWKAG